ncbi:DUF3817 domain-containing protein [Cellulomonas dongxiuzhuiae]|uniref:DUF3817 domain-containing protein n=1 Tax=Cellulomonas dongxiuzhuiae TaxID=2819979 RepID=A0ABX8GGC7_9CELL|nr:DUF3817 domain-containing protein [Cellulomonas dongxiuzhuiae]QWC15174.1 DUF3817 domain-containing protein [Cellulomonas dongxiuzhuiae]
MSAWRRPPPRRAWAACCCCSWARCWRAWPCGSPWRSSPPADACRGERQSTDDERTSVSNEPTSAPTGASPGTPTGASPAPDAAAWVRTARGALTRYRVMAWITGVMLLLLTVEMVLKYVLHAGGYDAEGELRPVLGAWIAYAHGWIYVLYLATVFQLWSTLRWPLGRLVTMAAAGVVPVMSFVLERRVHADADTRIAAAARTSA